jgi:hypothetical protein
MRKLIATIAAVAALTMLPVVTADFAAAKQKAKSAESTDSAPAPRKQAAAPNEGAASGEKGSSSGASGTASSPAWDESYKTDKAQEEQLKAGGK